MMDRLIKRTSNPLKNDQEVSDPEKKLEMSIFSHFLQKSLA